MLYSRFPTMFKCITFENEINTNIGIYSDITGYGKTLSIIGLIKGYRCIVEGKTKGFVLNNNRTSL